MSVINAGPVSEPITKTKFTSPSVIFLSNIESGLDLYRTAVFDCGIILSIFLSMKLVMRTVLTASSSIRWNVAYIKYSPMRTWKSVFCKTSIESFKDDHRCMLSAACRWKIQFSKKEAVAHYIWLSPCVHQASKCVHRVALYSGGRKYKIVEFVYSWRHFFFNLSHYVALVTINVL